MRKPLTFLLVASTLLSGCGGWRDSGWNPSNWFGRGRSVSVDAPPEAVNPLIPEGRRGIFQRPEKEDRSELIAAVRELRIERDPNGAIVYATGLASRNGAYAARLRLETEDLPPEDGVITFTFRVTYPSDPTPTGTERTRTIVEAHSLSTQELQGVKAIRVIAAQNALESRRR
ncbi:hypothetical protein [Pukyongiella litopenaei]|uniref:Lipoprotein n=1 Tax=Pukyongiella litopenaei TaxID=2605946 RepID=A0A2S0ML15_9RHOB|nr:hypothetical protein [Pukyongiella litopenaei]AVO36575.1 hypothetical protein C6Y53_01910 [Pukyongiella litopenaei]